MPGAEQLRPSKIRRSIAQLTAQGCDNHASAGPPLQCLIPVPGKYCGIVTAALEDCTASTAQFNANLKPAISIGTLQIVNFQRD